VLSVYSIQKKYNVGVYIQAIHDKPCTSFFIVVIQVLRCGVFNVVLVTNLWYYSMVYYMRILYTFNRMRNNLQVCQLFPFHGIFFLFISIQQIIDHLIFQFKFKKTCCYYIIMIPRPFLILNADIQTKGENTCGYIICKWL
jgi:hypothetical protein